MTGEVRFNSIFNYWWEELKWSGNFPVRWLYVKDVHHDALAHLLADDTPVTRLKDGSYVPRAVGVEVLRAFRATDFVSDIFEAFAFMDGREEKLRYKRDKVLAYVSELKAKGVLPGASAKSSKFHGQRRGKARRRDEEHASEKDRDRDGEYVKRHY